MQTRYTAAPRGASFIFRIFAGAIGLTAVASATRLTLQHAASSDPTSPVGTALVVFGALTVACAVAAPAAWRDRRHALALGLVLSALCGELFGLAATVERLASERAIHIRADAVQNPARAIARQKVSDTKSELIDASRRAADATKGGCREQCEALRGNEMAARDRVANAQAQLIELGADVSENSPLAGLTGLAAETIEIGLAVAFGLALSLGGAGLVAFATQGTLETHLENAPPTETLGAPHETPVVADAKADDPFAPETLHASVSSGTEKLSVSDNPAERFMDLLETRGGELFGSQRTLGAAVGISGAQFNRVLRDLEGAGRLTVTPGTGGTRVKLAA